LYALIAGSPNIREVSISVMREYFAKYKQQKVQFTKDVETGAQSAPGTFEAAKSKIVAFFNHDSSRFFEQLSLYDQDNTQRVQMEQFFHYLKSNTVNLSKQEEAAILSKFRAVPYTKLSIEYITSMLFFGKADLQISHLVQQPPCVQKFLTQMRTEMNLEMKGTFDIFK
jgi:hypothetical protein